MWRCRLRSRGQCARGQSRNACKDAMLQQRLLVNNPREVGYDDALAIYRAAFR
jgi:alcohol dehydrogenase class IV